MYTEEITFHELTAALKLCKSAKPPGEDNLNMLALVFISVY